MLWKAHEYWLAQHHLFHRNDGIYTVLTLNPLLPRLWRFKKLGGFKRGLFEFRDKPRFVWFVRASSAAPNFLKLHRKQAVGDTLFFGYFLLSKQKKVTRLEAKTSVTWAQCLCVIENNFTYTNNRAHQKSPLHNEYLLVLLFVLYSFYLGTIEL